jgi:hypothetical protein
VVCIFVAPNWKCITLKLSPSAQREAPLGSPAQNRTQLHLTLIINRTLISKERLFKCFLLADAGNTTAAFHFVESLTAAIYYRPLVLQIPVYVWMPKLP